MVGALDGTLEPDLGFGRVARIREQQFALEQQQLRRQHLRFREFGDDLEGLVDAVEAFSRPAGQSENRGVELQE